MDEYLRTLAKFCTTCPRCPDLIEIGDWISLVDGQGRWAHCVCPQDGEPDPIRTDAEHASIETVI
jgi:hypothetical protein